MPQWRASTTSLCKPIAVSVIIWAAMTGYSWQQTEKCASGWFGHRCEYRCRCASDRCMGTGECHPGIFCQAGWFGPACQYVDLAYKRTNPVVLTDGSDSTCIQDPTRTKVNITFARPYFFTWLRLVFSSGAKEVEVFFKDASTTESCDKWAHDSISQTMDIHCYVNKPFPMMFLEGNLEDMCSVYVSGGRQVALKQRAIQSLRYYEMSNNTDFKNVSYIAVKAVDGDINPDFYKGNTCSKTLPKPDAAAFWKLRFTGRRSVDRFVLYFPHGSSIYGHGLTLEVQGSDDAAAFEQSFAGSVLHPVFTVVLRVVNISVITIRTTAATLELCEVEVYGVTCQGSLPYRKTDSTCPAGKYGRDCERICSCPEGNYCFPSTGECYQGCPEGFEGETCNTCGVGRYGPGCASQCSVGCARFSDRTGAYCNNVNGSCLHGCIKGYSGAECSTNNSVMMLACEVGTYGPLCNLKCSTACAKVINDPFTYCDPTDGTCIYGCQSGFLGSKCNTTCPEETYGINCSLRCTPTCRRKAKEMCDAVNGLCLLGCVNGYNGAHCTDICKKGYYGKDCSKQCPVTCSALEKGENSSCDYVNGTCLYGCVDGYVGPVCSDGSVNPSTAADRAPNPWKTLYILSLFGPLGCIAIVLICKKVRDRKASVAEEENDIAQSVASLSTL